MAIKFVGRTGRRVTELPRTNVEPLPTPAELLARTLDIRPDTPLEDIRVDADAVAKLADSAFHGMFTKVYTERALRVRKALGIPDTHLAILSLDGGGVRGLIPLQVLVRFEEIYETPSYEIFDIIMGTSTGAIIGSMIASGMTAKAIRDFYHSDIHRVFKLDRKGDEPEPYAATYVLDYDPLVDRVFTQLGDVLTNAGLSEAQKRLFVLPIRAAVDGLVEVVAKSWAKRLAYNTFTRYASDRALRVAAGSPVYWKSYLRKRLRDTFSSRACATMGELSRKHGCVLIFTAVDATTGASVFMSATGSALFPGSCENALAASCVESSMSGPLFFNAFAGKLLDGGTLSSNMPLLGGLIHLERICRREIFLVAMPVDMAAAARRKNGIRVPHIGSRQAARRTRFTPQDLAHGKPQGELGSQPKELVLIQPFDMHETTIISLGCGVGPIRPITRDPLDIHRPQRHYDGDSYPYGELTRAFVIMERLGTYLKSLRRFREAAVFSIIGEIGSIVGTLALPRLVSSGISNVQRVKGFVENMIDSYENHHRFGLGALVNTIFFLKEGLGRNAWTIQEDLLRSSMYGGDFRRFQLSLDHAMLVNGMWRFHPNYTTRETVAANQPGYSMPYVVRAAHKVIKASQYDLITISNELTRHEKTKHFVLGIEPLGCLSLQWLNCLGERFADAIQEVCNQEGVPFLGIDLVDEDGQDVFVSPRARDHVSPERWQVLRSDLG